MDYKEKYLNQLSKTYPTIQAVSSELINQTAILNLPKGTEHFLSDIHGEYPTFNHFLKNGSGVIYDKISKLYPTMSEREKNQLAFFVYYPKQMLKKYQELMTLKEYKPFIRKILLNCISLSKLMSQKYTKSKIRKTLPEPFAYIIQELLFESTDIKDKEMYYNAIIDAIFKTRREQNFLIELAYFIQRLTIDRLHIVGDIFDRGPSAHLVLEKMMKYHSVDIEWGNHDVIWMGAATGSRLAICNVLRNSAKYNTLDTLEEGYGINLVPLAAFAQKVYKDDPCEAFLPNAMFTIDDEKRSLAAKIHKAISIMQFKMENVIFKRNPNFNLENHTRLHLINYEKGTIKLEGVTYKLRDTNFPTIDPNHPYRLTPEEHSILRQLKNSFLNNDLLQKHVKFLFRKGQMYLKYNNNLLFHGCIPLDEEGKLATMEIDGKVVKGKAMMDALEQKIRKAYHNRYEKFNTERDYFTFLWQGEHSPLFGKKHMKSFERYFIEDKRAHKEEMNNYFKMRENLSILKQIYDEFNIDFNQSKIINGHVPSDVTAGESPVKAEGRIYAIDGGMSKQYIEKINIGGYTLIADSYKLFLMSHERFPSVEDIISKEEDIISLVQSEEIKEHREYIYSTDKGKEIQNKINDLYELLEAYRNGNIKEQKIG